MIAIATNGYNVKAKELVAAALRRSVTTSLVKFVALNAVLDDIFELLVCINPDERLASKIIEALECKNKKIIIFGDMPDSLRTFLKLQPIEICENQIKKFDCNPAQKNSFSESLARIDYTPLAKKIVTKKLQSRPLCRYDFEDEWNNIGYGAIKKHGSIWGISCYLNADPENTVAKIKFNEVASVTFAGLFETSQSSLLWINRAVGLIDSGEWILVEKFISSWRATDRPCLPVLSEIPFGFDSLISMRLDCDEDLYSARSLWAFYRERSIPFSIAIHARILSDQNNIDALREMANAGVGIMSHSLTHAANWGGSYERAIKEADLSRKLIEDVAGRSIYYAVSPFHQTPNYALQALSDTGYRGCIGGIACNDPEFLIGRGGSLANMPSGFIGHSQQCMLHGDCLLNESADPLRIFKNSFDFAKNTRTAFCYLDHPISKRYDYAWGDGDRQIQMHSNLLNYITAAAMQPCFLDEINLLDYFYGKSLLEINKINNGFIIKNNYGYNYKVIPAVEYKGRDYLAEDGLKIQ